MEKNKDLLNIAIFFCQRVDADQDANRRPIEKAFGNRIRFFPLPCSGRIEPLHLMRALESGSDKVYVVTCPEGNCRYREGNERARKRVLFTQGLIEEIGMNKNALELIRLDQGRKITIDALARELLDKNSPEESRPVKVKTGKSGKRKVQGVIHDHC